MTHHHTKHTCSACGTAPINHTLAFTISIIEEIINRNIERLFVHMAKQGFWEEAARLLEKVMFYTSRALGVTKFNKDDVEKATIGRSKIIWEEARRRSIPMEQIVMFGRPTDYFRAHVAGKWHYFNSLPIPPWLPQAGYKWVDDKLRLARELTAAGIAAPKTIKVKTLKEAYAVFAVLQKPLIIKPEWGSRGRHTTTNIHTLEELHAAFKLVKQIAISVVVQEHLVGSVYRATVIDDMLVGFFRADQPRVTGDGVHTIRELIEKTNSTRRARVSEITVNEDLKNFIGRMGYVLDSVVPSGQTVNLSAKTGRMYGSYTKEMLPEVHPKIHDIFRRAGKLCEAPVLGFDLIMEDATKDPDTQRWGIIECNSLPFIDLHYMALEGEPIDLSKNVWDLWKKPGASS